MHKLRLCSIREKHETHWIGNVTSMQNIKASLLELIAVLADICDFDIANNAKTH